MGTSNFSIFNARFSSYLSKARRAAYTYAMRASGKGDEVSINHSADWQTPLADALEDFTKNLSWFPKTERDVIDALWMIFGLTEAYIHDVAEGSLRRSPLKWGDWILSDQGAKERKRFPLEKYDELVRQSNAEAKARMAMRDSYKTARVANRQQPSRAKASAPLSTVQLRQSNPPQSASTAVPLDPTESPTDVAFELATSLQSVHGIRIDDNRRMGGALWVRHLAADDDVARQLKRVRFKFHPTKGWWTK